MREPPVFMYAWKCVCGKVERFGSPNDYQSDLMLKSCFIMCQKCGKKVLIRKMRRYIQKGSGNRMIYGRRG